MYTEFELNPLDDNWLTAAMDFNLVGDAYLIGSIQNNNVQDLNMRYVDVQTTHRLYLINHLDAKK